MAGPDSRSPISLDEPGARFAKPLRMAEAFAAVEAHLKAIGRPATAFAQCELRSAEPFTDQGFIDFNRHAVNFDA